MANRFGRCLTCIGEIYFQECPTGGWWIHMNHPEDNHNADAGYYPEYMDDDGVFCFDEFFMIE